MVVLILIFSLGLVAFFGGALTVLLITGQCHIVLYCTTGAHMHVSMTLIYKLHPQPIGYPVTKEPSASSGDRMLVGVS